MNFVDSIGAGSGRRDVVEGYAHLYPLVRSGALFVMLMGMAMILGAVWFHSRNMLLVLGAVMAIIATSFAAVPLAAPYGPPRTAQVAWLFGAVLAQLVVLVIVTRRFGPRGERPLALAILLVVGLHFVPMLPAFGPIVAVLGVACATNALFAVGFSGYSLRILWGVDGALKVVFGALMWSVPVIGGHGHATV